MVYLAQDARERMKMRMNGEDGGGWKWEQEREKMNEQNIWTFRSLLQLYTPRPCTTI